LTPSFAKVGLDRRQFAEKLPAIVKSGEEMQAVGGGPSPEKNGRRFERGKK
jgi:hypothetical protein